MGLQVAAVAPSPCARSSSAVSSSPSTSSRALPGGARLPVNWGTHGAMVQRARLARMPARCCALSAGLDGNGMGGAGPGDVEFMERIEELAAAAAAGCSWPAGVERSASNAGLPLSLRMLKRRKQQQQQVVARHSRWDDEEGLLLVGEPVRRAFSSMVLIVRELQSFALQLLCDADGVQLRRGVVARVQAEMHASFVWLFQHIFAGTPALMLSLMLLLANFTVQSMGHSVAVAAAAAIPPAAAAALLVNTTHQQRAEPSVKAFSVGGGRTASVGGNGGGGGKTPPPVAGATGDGRSDESSLYRLPLSRVAPQQPSAAAPGADERAIWEMMLAEASKMQQQASARAEELSDVDDVAVAPVELETEGDHAEHTHTLTQQRYEHAVAAEPSNSLILANFAQFLYLVQSDHDRAEHYFERAVRAEPADSEALSCYATFLWKARNDLAGAEGAYQEAIAADPGNAHHAAAYAHFLWNTGACTEAATRHLHHGGGVELS